MGILLLSLSHKVAPLSIRQLFAFDEEQKLQLMLRLLEKEHIQEAVVLCTCNRTEIYAFTQQEEATRQAFEWIRQSTLEQAQAQDICNIGDYIRLYQGKAALHHAFAVTAGLDSMVLGEDQILGQVKQAHQLAMEHRMCSTCLNTLFRMAVTCAKKIKTQTDLSKTSVSIATLTLKAAEQALGSLQGKKLMLIGATGQIGGIVLKNACSIEGLMIYTTVREHKHQAMIKKENCHVIPYEERYRYLNEMDIVVSATGSPHYTITSRHFKDVVTNGKKRVLIDLAVPMDIEDEIGILPYVTLYHIEEFSALAKQNNIKKQEEAKAAELILEEYEEQFEKWLLFRDHMPQLHSLAERMAVMLEQKGAIKGMEQMFYDIREECSAKELQTFCEIAAKIIK